MTQSYFHWMRERVGQDTVIFNYAAALIRDSEGRILLHKRTDVELWGFPGGLQELGESLTETVKREVREELGLTVEPKQLIGIYSSPAFARIYPNGDSVQPMIALYECEIRSGTIVEDETEVAGTGWFKFDELPPLMPCCVVKARDAKNFTGQTFFR